MCQSCNFKIEVFNSIKEYAKESKCVRRKVAAAIVLDLLEPSWSEVLMELNTPIACETLGCMRKGIKSGTQLEKCRAIHAEQNVIYYALNEGLDLQGATMVVTHSPCMTCAKTIIQAGIREVIFGERYPNSLDALQLLQHEGISLFTVKDGELHTVSVEILR